MKKLAIVTSILSVVFLSTTILVYVIYAPSYGRPSLDRVEKTPISIRPLDVVDGRTIYDVFAGGKWVGDQMYAEEIAISLISGTWQYDETAHICNHEICPNNQE